MVAQTTAIPDVIFEEYLETHASDGSTVDIGDQESMGDGIANNGLVLTERISDVTLLNINGLGISDLSGIDDFVSIETLFCSNNQLTTINISNNLSLISLSCGSNFLTELILDSNTDLEILDCADNQIQDLDLTNNTALISLTATGNQFTSLDVTSNSELTFLSVSNNRIAGELNHDVEDIQAERQLERELVKVTRAVS